MFDDLNFAGIMGGLLRRLQGDVPVDLPRRRPHPEVDGDNRVWRCTFGCRSVVFRTRDGRERLKRHLLKVHHRSTRNYCCICSDYNDPPDAAHMDSHIDDEFRCPLSSSCD